ncbi:MAG: YfhO family protein [Anaerovoracaceae bacterium]
MNSTQAKINRFFSKNKAIFAAFVIPVFIVLIAFLTEGIYPFGENQIAVIDMYHQYVPFLSELQYKLQEGGSLFYTWNGAGGSNFWNLISYYGASPLNLLLAVIPKKFIMEGVTLILLIKIGLAGSFMAVYLKNINKTGSMAVVGFSTLYALCSYVMAYYWCIMWIDAVALLPLCILGLNRLIDSGRTVMYTVTLALIIFINYYTAIMVCIFIMFYYPVLYFIKVKSGGAKHCFLVTAKAVGHSVLAVAIAGVMLIPTYLSMQGTYYISADMPDNWLFYNDALDILNQLLPGSELTYREGLPNLYCGLIVVILLVFYIISKTITIKEKALNIGFLTFLFLSLNINKLDFIWHGFHFPNQLPYRYTFVICFILIGMAYKAFLRIDEVKTNHVWVVLAAGIGYYVLAQKILADSIDGRNLFLYGGICWLILYCTVLAIYKKGYLKKQMMALLMVMLIGCEMTSNACTSMDKIGNTLRDTYFANSQDIISLTQEYKDDFARTEIDGNYILNCPALYHYKGLSQFSSSINANTTAIMERIGLEGEPGKNRFNYNQTNPVTNAILNVKYLIGKNLPIEDSDFKLIDSKGHTRLYENQYPLSIGYMLGNEIRTWNYESDNPFDVLDDYVRAATGNEYDKVFYDIGMPVIAASNAKVNVQGSGIMTCSLEDADSKSSVILNYKAETAGKHYVFIEADKAESIIVDTGQKEDEIDIRNDCGSIVNIGELEQGQEFRITIEYDEGKIGDIVSHVSTMDESKWQQVYGLISQNMLEVTDFGDNYIKGNIDAEKDGVFVTSIPYESGWTLKVDGREREINELIGGSFISASLSEGSHQIELYFRPPGFILGVVSSAAGATILVFAEIFRRRRQDRSR